MGHGGEASFGPDDGCLVVVEIDPGLPGRGFLYPKIQHAFAAAISRTQFCIHVFNAGVLLEQLQPLLQRIDRQGRAGSAFDAIPQIGGAEPICPFHIDAGQTALDDVERDDAGLDILIRDDGA